MRPVPAHPASTDAPGHNPVRLSGPGPLVTDLSLDDLERDARHAVGEMAYAYYAGGADDERLLQGNVEAWSHWQLHPHVLAGLSEVSPATTLLGTPVNSPVAVAPTAIEGLAYAEGQGRCARGRRCGRLAAHPDLPRHQHAGGRCCCRASGANCWMQIYILREEARTEETGAPGSSPRPRRLGRHWSTPPSRVSACASGASVSTCPTTWPCPTSRATAPTAHARVDSWPWSRTSSSPR